ncbi:hypothetical protein KP509_16G049300 [Ceratopteris richardii]|nr:hypothetical protein KP509_16G049300 [Ceratopteris richardii]
MDDKKLNSSKLRPVVVAATNRINSIDPALRRPGRFDREIEITAPNAQERYEILQLHASRLPLDDCVELRSVADMCNGYVGADLAALCREAALASLRRGMQGSPSEGDVQHKVTMQDWEQAHLKVGPSIARGAVADVPSVLWDDIGGLTQVKRKLRQTVEWPIQHADALARLGLKPIRGVLLYGPPGCSKTTLVKAAAHAAKANLFSLSGAELHSMYVGEGEALLRETFRRARLVAPSIVFFDEADSVAARREGGNEQAAGGNSTGEKLLSTLLTEIDGLELAQGVLVLGATNRPWSIDGALMRPGRFDQILYVPPPDKEGRLEILKVHTRNMKVADDVDLSEIASITEYFTGAELAGLCSEAGMAALRENLYAESVHERHFSAALKSIKPSLTVTEISKYVNFGLTRNMR